jgi:hypothetical protein
MKTTTTRWGRKSTSSRAARTKAELPKPRVAAWAPLQTKAVHTAPLQLEASFPQFEPKSRFGLIVEETLRSRLRLLAPKADPLAPWSKLEQELPGLVARVSGTTQDGAGRHITASIRHLVPNAATFEERLVRNRFGGSTTTNSTTPEAEAATIARLLTFRLASARAELNTQLAATRQVLAETPPRLNPVVEQVLTQVGKEGFGYALPHIEKVLGNALLTKRSGRAKSEPSHEELRRMAELAVDRRLQADIEALVTHGLTRASATAHVLTTLRSTAGQSVGYQIDSRFRTELGELFEPTRNKEMTDSVFEWNRLKATQDFFGEHAQTGYREVEEALIKRGARTEHARNVATAARADLNTLLPTSVSTWDGRSEPKWSAAPSEGLWARLLRAVRR